MTKDKGNKPEKTEKNDNLKKSISGGSFTNGHEDPVYAEVIYSANDQFKYLNAESIETEDRQSNEWSKKAPLYMNLNELKPEAPLYMNLNELKPPAAPAPANDNLSLVIKQLKEHLKNEAPQKQKSTLIRAILKVISQFFERLWGKKPATASKKKVADKNKKDTRDRNLKKEIEVLYQDLKNTKERTVYEYEDYKKVLYPLHEKLFEWLEIRKKTGASVDLKTMEKKLGIKLDEIYDTDRFLNLDVTREMQTMREQLSEIREGENVQSRVQSRDNANGRRPFQAVTKVQSTNSSKTDQQQQRFGMLGIYR